MRTFATMIAMLILAARIRPWLTILAFTIVAVALAMPVLTPLMWRKIEKD
jgi:hypothetical protein